MPDTNKLLTVQELKTFRQFGYYPKGTSGGNQVYGNCIFCGKKEKFYVNTSNKTWDCKSCGKAGGFQTFLREVLKFSQTHFKGHPARELSKSRSLSVDTLKRAQIGYNPLTRSYIIPIMDMTGEKIHDLRIYKRGQLRSTAGCRTGLYGWEQLGGAYVNTWLAEGEWDCLVIKEALHNLNKTDEIVVAVPGANTFKKEWIPLFQDCNVNVLYDNDDAGRDGSVKVYNMIKDLTRTLNFLHWRDTTPKGQDVRDIYIKVNKKPANLFKRIKLALKDNPQGADKSKYKINQAPSNLFTFDGKGHTHDYVYKIYTKWLKLKSTDVLDILFGTLIANRMPGDPVWLFLTGASGAAKTELVNSFDGFKNVISISDLTTNTLISGATFAGGGDPSLIPRLNEKVLLIKDFTGFLSMNQTQRDEIFGQLRDAYDGKCAKPLGNGVFRKYESTFGIIAATTLAIEIFIAGLTALGERFLSYYLTLPKTLKEEQDIIKQAMDNTTREKEMRAELNKCALETLNYDFKKIPKMSPEMAEKVMNLAQWTAIVRGTVVRDRFTKEVTHKPFRELGTRLAKQFSKLIYGVGMFKRLDKVTEREYQTLKHAATSSVPSKMREFIRIMYNHNKHKTWTISELAGRIRLPGITCERTAEDLRMLGALDKVEINRLKKEWALSKNILQLMHKAEIFK